MIVDTSALVALVFDEATSVRIIECLAATTAPRISAGNALEAGIVIDGRRDPLNARRLDSLMDRFGFVVEPVDGDQVAIARSAYRDIGKGSGHPAQLNYGDCFAYALAVTRNEPLLFVGRDFTHTDVVPAIAWDD